MRLPMSRRLAILVCSLSVLGCSESLAPEDLAGLYELERIGSEAVPAVLWESENRTVWVSAGSIRLRSDGTGIFSSVDESISPLDGHSAIGPVSWERAIRFRTALGRIEIEMLCAPNENCAPPPHLVARRTADGLRVTYFQSSIRMHYAKVPNVATPD